MHKRSSAIGCFTHCSVYLLCLLALTAVSFHYCCFNRTLNSRESSPQCMVKQASPSLDSNKDNLMRLCGLLYFRGAADFLYILSCKLVSLYLRPRLEKNLLYFKTLEAYRKMAQCAQRKLIVTRKTICWNVSTTDFMSM